MVKPSEKIKTISTCLNGVNIDELFDSDDDVRKVSILVNGGKLSKEKENITGYSEREKNTINSYNKLINNTNE